MSIQGIYGSRSDIKSINYIDFHVRVGANNTENGTIVTINKHILLGRYPTALLAMQAIEGALVKTGVNEPFTRRAKLISSKKALFTGADFTPTSGNPINWLNITTTRGSLSYGNTRNQAAMAGCTVPLLVRLEVSDVNFQIWTKLKSVTTGETTGVPSATGYTLQQNNGLVSIPMSQYLFLKTDNPTITTGNKAATLSIYNAYDETLLDTITLTVNA